MQYARRSPVNLTKRHAQYRRADPNAVTGQAFMPDKTDVKILSGLCVEVDG